MGQRDSLVTVNMIYASVTLPRLHVGVTLIPQPFCMPASRLPEPHLRPATVTDDLTTLLDVLVVGVATPARFPAAERARQQASRGDGGPGVLFIFHVSLPAAPHWRRSHARSRAILRALSEGSTKTQAVRAVFRVPCSVRVPVDPKSIAGSTGVQECAPRCRCSSGSTNMCEHPRSW
jgi:hypothetical protein